MAAHQAKESQEICADNRAVRFIGARSANYGKVLVKATVQRLDEKTGLPSVGLYQYFAIKSKKTLFKRLMALEKPHPLNPRWMWISVTLLILFGLAVILPWQISPPVIYW